MLWYTLTACCSGWETCSHDDVGLRCGHLCWNRSDSLHHRAKTLSLFPRYAQTLLGYIPGCRGDLGTNGRSFALSAWWYPPKDDTKPVILFYHGMGNSIRIRPPKAQPYRDQGYGVLLAEYRGYGGNPGQPTEEGLYQDARAYANWLINTKNVPLKQIVLYGESLGTGIAIHMALEYPQAFALILEVPYFSILEMTRFRAPFIPFVEKVAKDHYRSDLKIGQVKMPVYFGLGERDFIVPSRFGKKLFEAANEPKQLRVYLKAGHMGIYQKGFGRDAIEFLDKIART